jgi:hypothetical protein
MVDILNAVLTDGLPAVEAACAEALSHGVVIVGNSIRLASEVESGDALG